VLLQRCSGNRVERRHDGRVAFDRRDTRWCSDRFEIGCEASSTHGSTLFIRARRCLCKADKSMVRLQQRRAVDLRFGLSYWDFSRNRTHGDLSLDQ
jgi:hypothetical protein